MLRSNARVGLDVGMIRADQRGGGGRRHRLYPVRPSLPLLRGDARGCPSAYLSDASLAHGHHTGARRSSAVASDCSWRRCDASSRAMASAKSARRSAMTRALIVGGTVSLAGGGDFIQARALSGQVDGRRLGARCGRPLAAVIELGPSGAASGLPGGAPPRDATRPVPTYIPTLRPRPGFSQRRIAHGAGLGVRARPSPGPVRRRASLCVHAGIIADSTVPF